MYPYTNNIAENAEKIAAIMTGRKIRDRTAEANQFFRDYYIADENGIPLGNMQTALDYYAHYFGWEGVGGEMIKGRPNPQGFYAYYVPKNSINEFSQLGPLLTVWNDDTREGYYGTSVLEKGDTISDPLELIICAYAFVGMDVYEPPKRSTLYIPDDTGYDIGELVENHSRANGIEPKVTLCCILAESGLDPRAERWGFRTNEAKQILSDPDPATRNPALARLVTRLAADGTPYDISFGFAQFIYTTAGRAGIGDGSDSVENLLQIRDILFDRDTGVRLCAEYIRNCRDRVINRDLLRTGPWQSFGALAGLSEDDRIIIWSLALYNGGENPVTQGSWWNTWGGNIRNYRSNLIEANRILGL